MNTSHPTDYRRIAGALSLALALGLSGAQAADAFSGFETTDGYTEDATYIGVNDAGLGGTWQMRTGSSSSQFTSREYNNTSGDLSLQVTGNATATQVAFLDMDLPTLNDTVFNVSFDWAVGADISVGTSAQSTILFGADHPFDANRPSWFQLRYSDDTVTLLTGNFDTSARDSVNLGVYTNYGALGDFISVDITIDGAAEKYTSVVLGGIDVTHLVLASNGGNTLSFGENPLDFFTAYTGSNDSGSFYIDNVQVTVIPEPSTAAVLIGLGVLGMVGFSRRRSS